MYTEITVKCLCGNTFQTRSTRQGNQHRNLLRLPSVFHRQAEADGHRRPRRALQETLRPDLAHHRFTVRRGFCRQDKSPFLHPDQRDVRHYECHPDRTHPQSGTDRGTGRPALLFAGIHRRVARKAGIGRHREVPGQDHVPGTSLGAGACLLHLRHRGDFAGDHPPAGAAPYRLVFPAVPALCVPQGTLHLDHAGQDCRTMPRRGRSSPSCPRRSTRPTPS